MFGLFAPGGTPPAIIAAIQKAVATVFGDRDFRERYVEKIGFTGVASPPAAFAKFIKDDLEYKRRLISVTGIKAE